ncbi:hypothetical protein [Nitrosomonas sp. Nm51]
MNGQKIIQAMVNNEWRNYRHDQKSGRRHQARHLQYLPD